MSDIEITREHQLSLEELRNRMREIEQKLLERFGIRITWSGDLGSIEGRGLQGNIELSASEVKVRLKLGMALSFVAGKIRDGMMNQLEKTLTV
jgi:putative polyhydroxyalkanoate system protein